MDNYPDIYEIIQSNDPELTALYERIKAYKKETKIILSTPVHHIGLSTIDSFYLHGTGDSMLFEILPGDHLNDLHFSKAKSRELEYLFSVKPFALNNLPPSFFEDTLPEYNRKNLRKPYTPPIKNCAPSSLIKSLITRVK